MLVLECRNAPCCHRGHNYTGGGHTGLLRLAAGTGGFVLLRAHIGAGEGWWGGAIVGRGASCGKCLVDIPRCWGHCLLDITQLGRAGAWPPHHQPGDSSILEF